MVYSRRDALQVAFIAMVSTLATTAIGRPQPPIGPVIDHHIHLGSPALEAYIAEVDKADPSAFEHLSRDIFSKPTLATALHLLDEAHIRQAVLLSSAYLYMIGVPAPVPADIARKVRDENRFVVDAALASRGRLLAFIAVDPLASTAREELAYWTGRPGVRGLKLHLGAAGYHGSSPEQVAALADIFRAAREARLPIVVHMRGGGSYSRAEVETFIDKVLPQAGDLPVQIAHGGGYAGADPATIDALTAFGAAIARQAPGTRNLVFDLSGVVLPDDTAAALGSSDGQLKLFAGLMRGIGLDRFVLGSDWPALGRIAPYYTLMRAKLPVSDAEWARLCRNRAPYIRAGH